jgi:DNA-binding CsgD family transcriptional regulator
MVRFVRTLPEGRSPVEIVERVVSATSELFHVPSLVMRPVRAPDGFHAEYLASRRLRKDGIATLRSTMRDSAQPFFLYNPLRPEPEQRNVVHRIRTDAPGAVERARPAFHRMGVGKWLQSRILICDGPFFLMFLGTYSEPGGKAPNSERLRAFACGIRPALRLLLGLGRDPTMTMLEAVLEALQGEAYLVDARGKVAYANELGTRLVQARGSDLVTALTAAASGAPSPYEVTPIAVTAGAPWSLVRRTTPDVVAADAVRRARAGWNLTHRQVELLERLLDGESNKEIAEHMTISFRTVEVHLGNLLVKARVESRLQLVAGLLTGKLPR